ncbi:MAG: hypothetical protein ABI411_12800 [Tahibacter sp.]
MKTILSVVSVLIGYAIFASSVLVFFHIVGQPPHQDAPLGVALASVLVGIIAAFLGGYAAGGLAGRRPLAHAVAVAAVLSAGAIASLISTLGHGSIWTQLAALLLMAPSAVCGGWLCARMNRE